DRIGLAVCHATSNGTHQERPVESRCFSPAIPRGVPSVSPFLLQSRHRTLILRLLASWPKIPRQPAPREWTHPPSGGSCSPIHQRSSAASIFYRQSQSLPQPPECLQN